MDQVEKAQFTGLFPYFFNKIIIIVALEYFWQL